jgi:hypothetical protein
MPPPVDTSVRSAKHHRAALLTAGPLQLGIRIFRAPLFAQFSCYIGHQRRGAIFKCLHKAVLGSPPWNSHNSRGMVWFVVGILLSNVC